MTARLEEWDVRLRALFGLSLLHHPARLRDGIRAACKELGIEDDAVLLSRVATGDHLAKTALARALTIGETYFFREPPHFDLLRGELLPAAIARGSEPVVLVSAACSSGEEAYTMAIVARQVLGVAATEKIRVLGADVNERAIIAARQGEYRAWSLRGVRDDVRERWLERTPGGDAWKVVPAVRSLVTFERRNLVDPAEALAPASADVIFCRNVLIYLDDEHVSMVLQSLARALRPGGSLVVSSAEAALFAASGLGTHQRGEVWVHSPGDGPERARQRFSANATSTASPPSAVPVATVAASVAEERSRTRARNEAARGERAARSAAARERSTAANGDRVKPNATDDPTAGRVTTEDVCAVLESGWASLAADPSAAAVSARRAILLDRSLAAAHVLAASAAVAQLDTSGARRSLRNARRYLSAVPPTDVVRGGGGATAAELNAYCVRLERSLEARSR